MKRLFLSFVFGVLLTGLVVAQEQNVRPQRTPEEEASKQTERLVRELGIRDSVRIDTIYRMHLKYAQIRQKGLTRAENMERMQSIYNELKQLLSPDEFERFMNHPAEQPRRPRGANVHQQKPPVAPNGEAPNKPTLREELQQADQP